MADKEKVIKGLKHCDFGVSGTCYEKECPYYQSHDCTDKLKNDILDLLKEQETKQVKQVELYGKEEWYGLACKCPDCKAIWMGSKSETHFCPNCGRPVKWDA